jgi:hypothetical protein
VVHVEHQLGCLGQRVTEQLLEHERHVRHQVDGVVPDDDEPGFVRLRDLIRVDVLGPFRGDQRFRRRSSFLTSEISVSLFSARIS